jgi:branched-subunit amino acid ABC-type transport system permease component
VAQLIEALGFGLVTASVVALAAVGITLQFGVTNYLGLGAFVAWFINSALGVTFWLAVVGGALFTGIFSVVVSRLLLDRFARRNPPAVYMLMVTLGLWLFLSNLLLIVWGTEIRHYTVAADTPVKLGVLQLTVRQLIVMVVAVVVLLLIHLLLHSTKIGKQMRALSDDSALAQVSGVNTDYVVSVTWLISGCLVGLSGCTLALALSGFGPGFGDAFLFVIFSAVILGGIGQPYGAMLGALIVGFATELSGTYLNAAYKTDFAFLFLILTLFIRPQGLLASRGRH